MNINATLIGQSIAFIIFIWFCMKFVWPPIIKALEERKKKIADGLAYAEKADKKLAQAREKADEYVRLAQEQARTIVDIANQKSTTIIDQAREHAQNEARKIKNTAQQEVAHEILRAKETLRKQVGALVVAGASQIISESIDETKNKKLVEKLAAEL